MAEKLETIQMKTNEQIMQDIISSIRPLSNLPSPISGAKSSLESSLLWYLIIAKMWIIMQRGHEIKIKRTRPCYYNEIIEVQFKIKYFIYLFFLACWLFRFYERGSSRFMLKQCSFYARQLCCFDRFWICYVLWFWWKLCESSKF